MFTSYRYEFSVLPGLPGATGNKTTFRGDFFEMNQNKRSRVAVATLMVVMILAVALPVTAQESTPVLSVTYGDGSTIATEGVASGPTWQFYVNYSGVVVSAQVTMPDGTIFIWDDQNGAHLVDPCGPGGGTASWHWVLAGDSNLVISDASCAPLAVVLNSFSAVCQGSQILVTWETASEINNTGFNLIRGVEGPGTTVQIWFVPSQSPGGTSGASYSFVDSTAVVGVSYAYSLESVDTTGTTVRYGPEIASCEPPSALKLATFSAESARVERLPGCAGVGATILLGAVGFVLFQSRRRRRNF